MVDNQIELQLYQFSKDLEEIERLHKDVLTESFNVFESAGLTRQEIRHSNILAFLLKPNGMHGLGEDLLKQLLELASINSEKRSDLPNPLYISTHSYEDLEVAREESNIDVLGSSKQSNLVFVIENKIKSTKVPDPSKLAFNCEGMQGYGNLSKFL